MGRQKLVVKGGVLVGVVGLRGDTRVKAAWQAGLYPFQLCILIVYFIINLLKMHKIG